MDGARHGVERFACRWIGVRRLQAHPAAARDFRTVVLLAALTVLNLFDLAFTQTQMERGNFAEANVVAAAVAGSVGGAVAYKTALFGAGAYILFCLRRRWQSEAGLWLLLACYSGLMFWWVAYLDAVERCLSDPAVTTVLATF